MSKFASASSPVSQVKEKKLTKQQRQQRQQDYNANRNTSFTMDEIDEFRQAFDFYANHTKTIEFKDLERALRCLGYFLSALEMETLLSLLNVDGDTTLDFSEFCMVIECVKREQGEFGDLRNSFRVLDLNNDGFVKAEDLIQLITGKGDEKMTHEEASELVEFAGKDQAGKINYEDFINRLMKLENESSSTALQNAEQTKPDLIDPVRKQKSNGNKERTGKKVVFDAPRCELVDSVDKALGGPVLLASAIIINFGQNLTKVKDH